MDLLIIRTGDHYLRFKDNQMLVVGLDKASVFPMDRLDHVKALRDRAEAEGREDVRIKKLMLKEVEL